MAISSVTQADPLLLQALAASVAEKKLQDEMAQAIAASKNETVTRDALARVIDLSQDELGEGDLKHSLDSAKATSTNVTSDSALSSSSSSSSSSVTAPNVSAKSPKAASVAPLEHAQAVLQPNIRDLIARCEAAVSVANNSQTVGISANLVSLAESVTSETAAASTSATVPSLSIAAEEVRTVIPVEPIKQQFSKHYVVEGIVHNGVLRWVHRFAGEDETTNLSTIPIKISDKILALEEAVDPRKALEDELEEAEASMGKQVNLLI